ncbi:MAG: hypothetical protein KJ550_08720 [Proteobacteria bacterium]|nr:hypothetical protein [Desulfobacteraceae bacterium]MBU3981698.1 hypothetical protein [Pseudomonadota bacterium]MBU4013535.1 hypothetical protein [Pseudomonadota bacterium]MBU4099970.1 hypothetical protein [Pseudomonadota bacterium]MBU4420311.1 hypothetical protein [Pseudomonadota bacterium]
MKKLIVLVCAVVFLFGAIGIAQAHSDWAKYKNQIVPADTKGVPGKYVNKTINCCDCHGRISSIPPLDCR